MAKKKQSNDNIAARNRKARHDYFIEENIEAGIMLQGTEIKSIRNGRASIEESYASEEGGELFLVNAYIPEYQAGGRDQHETRRPRKLLLHKKELTKLANAVNREGMTIIPLSLYFNKRGMLKVDLGMAKGKRQHDKRQTDKDRDWKRDQGRIMRGKNG
ncbi:MAG: SsrA-binding protein SmpB [Rhodospirillaceae bacterium]|jgi:SsrA-binding protein|nr:SsrA-binding protein SmpB [Rhodospirillaceae bacterium]MBT4940076.1 SsrA-binding protein SmpB [Rhodospirillaceae bacterium]MBT5940604.1 SsrA-binding protein SmpB [Rhodospirillaceae bacterium]MBT7268679.1 SsrA-binding protein SmpB [Rhodospirillaceae bacterium]